MVHCERDEYEASLWRLIHGDVSPGAPGFKAERIPCAIDGRYTGREQEIESGSFVVVPPHRALDLASFSLQCWIWPTTPTSGRQGLLTRWSPGRASGFGLFVDESGGLALFVGMGGDRGVHRVRTGVSLRARTWYCAVATLDAESRTASVYQLPCNRWAVDPTVATETAPSELPEVDQDAPLLMGASWRGTEARGLPDAQHHFNGKIASPRVFGRSFSRDEVHDLAAGASRADTDLVAEWDFAASIESDRVIAKGRSGLHGIAVNMPMRGVTDHTWDGREIDFRSSPGHYGAMYFHDDDLADARWQRDFALTVPSDLRSGVYAVRVTTNESEDHIPFFVRPRKGGDSAPIALLMPTLSYQAYGNYHVLSDPKKQAEAGYSLDDALASSTPYEVDRHRFMIRNSLLSLYDYHGDGSGTCYASRLRPIVSMRPKYNLPGKGSDGGASQFNADLYIVDWLTEKGFEFDVITDEDLHAEGADLLRPYRTVLTGTHPEYSSEAMLIGLEAYLEQGGRLMYLGGNGFYWVDIRRSQPAAHHRDPARGVRHEAMAGWAWRVPAQHHRGVGRAVAIPRATTTEARRRRPDRDRTWRGLTVPAAPGELWRAGRVHLRWNRRRRIDRRLRASRQRRSRVGVGPCRCEPWHAGARGRVGVVSRRASSRLPPRRGGDPECHASRACDRRRTPRCGLT